MKSPCSQLRWFGLMILIGVMGCGSGLSSVTGKVMYKGTPAAGAVVVFHPKGASPESPRPTGAVKENGTFSLETITTPGAAPGDYSVTVVWDAPATGKKLKKGMGGEDEREAKADRLGGKYSNLNTTPLKVTINPGSNQLEPFQLD
ncbi:MAG: hypothetical protein EBV06_11715 [Planctomycetia bacterium]|nr:hypothetical protein [Planctomycetia bacterium]